MIQELMRTTWFPHIGFVYLSKKNMTFILYYLLIGITIMFLLDMHLNVYKKQIENEMGEKIEYDTFTRIFIIVVWPAALFIILKNLPWGR